MFLWEKSQTFNFPGYRYFFVVLILYLYLIFCIAKNFCSVGSGCAKNLPKFDFLIFRGTKTGCYFF